MVQQLVQDEVAPMVWFNKCNPDDANFPDVHKRLALFASQQAQVEPKPQHVTKMQHQIASMQKALQHGEQELAALRATNYEEVTHLQHCLSNALNEVAALKGQLQEMVQHRKKTSESLQDHCLIHDEAYDDLKVVYDDLKVAYADLVKEAEQLKEKQQRKVEAYEQLLRDYDKLQADHGRIKQLLSSQQPKQPERPEQPQQDEFEDLAKAMAQSLGEFVAEAKASAIAKAPPQTKALAKAPPHAKARAKAKVPMQLASEYVCKA